MKSYATLTGVCSILIVLCIFLYAKAVLLWLMLERWDGWRAIVWILLSFVTAYIAISYMVMALREYVPVPHLFWE